MSSNSVTSKIIIDVEEYLYLKSLEQKLQQKNNEIKELLKNQTPSNSDNPTTSAVEVSDNSITKNKNNSEISSVDSAVLENIIKLAKSQLDQRNKVGEGGEDEGFLPGVPETIESKTVDANLLITPIIKTDNKHNSSVEIDQLLKKVPSRFQLRAKNLLDKLLEDPDQFTFDSNGTLIINNDPITNSNFFVLFPKLFNGSVKNKSTGFTELLEKIAELDLGLYLNKKLTKGFFTNKPIKNRSELKRKVLENRQWWFLGT